MSYVLVSDEVGFLEDLKVRTACNRIVTCIEIGSNVLNIYLYYVEEESTVMTGSIRKLVIKNVAWLSIGGLESKSLDIEYVNLLIFVIDAVNRK